MIDPKPTTTNPKQPTMNEETKTPEPLAAILKEMRDFCSGWSEDVDVTVKVGLIYGWMCRIEAAAKRERAITDVMLAVKDKPLPHPDPEHAPPLYPGNAAALREALANVERVAKFCAETPRHTPGYPTDAARAAVLYSRISELGRVARAALAAPARNCDRFATPDEAIAALRANPCANHDFCKEQLDCAECATRWLVAPAKKGGAK